jgi:hypothetical protein
MEKKQFDAKNMEMFEYIHGNPTCRKPGCFGRGWTGITVEGSPILCSCAVVTSPMMMKVIEEQQKLVKKVEELAERFELMNEELVKKFEANISWQSALAGDITNRIDMLIESRSFRSLVKKQVRERMKNHGQEK